MSYRVKTVATMTGIPRPTLLAWERRYDFLEPRRSEGGYRIYTDDDVALLKRLKRLVDDGHPISEAVGLARSRPVATDLRTRLLTALLAYDQDAVDRMAPELHTLAFAQALDAIHLPILKQLGDGWESGEITIAQEHFVSTWCRLQMMAMFQGLGGGPAHGPRALCAMAPGEVHELGLLAVAIRLALGGWRVTWLGADLPIAELVSAARTAKPAVVCLSMMLEVPAEDAIRTARTLRDGIDPSILVAVGGRAVRGLASDSRDGLLFCPTFDVLLDRLRADGRAAQGPDR